MTDKEAQQRALAAARLRAPEPTQAVPREVGEILQRLEEENAVLRNKISEAEGKLRSLLRNERFTQGRTVVTQILADLVGDKQEPEA